MDYKKTWLSYICWAVFAVLTIGYVVTQTIKVGEFVLPVDNMVIIILFIVALLCLLFGAFLLLKGVNAHLHNFLEKRKLLFEALVVICILAAAIFCRVYYMSNHYYGVSINNDYYAGAMIKSSGQIPNVTNSATYMYSSFLSTVFSFMGNKAIMAVFFQIVLQILTCVLLYFAIRLLCGRIPAVIAGALLAFSKIYMDRATVIAPDVIYMLYWSIGLLVIGCYFQKAAKSGWYRNNICEIIMFCMSFYIGVLCYWDILGIVLVFVLLSAVFCANRLFRQKCPELFEKTPKKSEVADIYVEAIPTGNNTDLTEENILDAQKIQEEIQKINIEAEKQERLKKAKKIMSGMTQLNVTFCGILLGFGVTVMKYTGLTGNTFFEQLEKLVVQYTPTWTLQVSFPAEQLVLQCVICAFAFTAIWAFIKKKGQNSVLWMLLILLLSVILPCSGIKNIETTMWVTLLWSIAGGLGIQMIFTQQILVQPLTIREQLRRTFDRRRATEEWMQPQQETVAIAQAPVTKEEDVKEKPRFIENPLPLPKKHEKRTMDYPVDLENEKLDFDFDLKENDDFDID